MMHVFFFFFSSRRRHTRLQGDWSSDVCSSDLACRRSEPVALEEAEGDQGIREVRHGAGIETEDHAQLFGCPGRGAEGGEETELDRREEDLGRPETDADLEDALGCELV